ncbi:MAG TPA: VWA domain-containing protein [Chloroflexaceae bacterium]|nr:VWA domain-containing protein [Chloroflexaceae bacterium]
MSGDEVFLTNCLTFAGMLQRAGLPVGLEQRLDMLRALGMVNLGWREQVYHACRSMLVARREHLPVFDALFARFWRRHAGGPGARRQTMPRAPRHRPRAQPFTIVTYMAYRARLSDEPVDVADKSGTFSPAELLQRKEFAAMTPEELAQVRRLIQRLDWRVSWRVTRRRAPRRRGDELLMRRVVREAARHGGVPLRLPRQQRKRKPRPLVIIADISGSMEKYSRLLLQLCYSAARRLGRVESFVFGTRLTRISAQLRLRNLDRALELAAREVVDWGGGTRIGASLRSFNRRWARRALGRGAVVLLISDGWEHGDPQALAREVRALRRRCHRLIWLNPLAGREGYAPRAAGMAAAVRHVDDFLPIHNLQSLEELAARLAALAPRRARA